MTAALTDPTSTTCGHRPAPKVKLSDRQREVLEQIAGGGTNAQIARRLNVAEDSVKTIARAAYAKLACQDRTSAVVRALQLGLITVPGIGPCADAPGARPGGRWVWRQDDDTSPEPSVTLRANPRDADLLLRAWSKDRPPLDAAVAREHALDVLARLCGTETAR